MAELSETDLDHLRAAFGVATLARDAGNLPFGCVVADATGKVVIDQPNMALVPQRDPTAHAETLAAATAARRYEPGDLALFTLYSNVEPCAMCAGAVYWSGIGRVVYGLDERDLRQMTGDHNDNPTMDLPCREVFAAGQRPVEVFGPELVDEARAVFDGYWD